MKAKPLFLSVFTILLSMFLGKGASYAAHKPILAREITGTVKDAGTGEVLVGCTVTLKGSTKGVITDVDGHFTIDADSDDVLVFAFIGYETKEAIPGNRTNLEVSLVSNTEALKEIVVIGYGSTQSKDITGSAKSIKSEDFNKGIINSPEQLLQGKVAGVNINAASGEPGSPLSITVRGPGGVRTGSTPLFVIDGFALDNSSEGGSAYQNPLAFLNPADIESIDILKDASATAIYGSRGANGVVLITTKKGKEGTSSLNYTGSVGFSTMANPIDVFTADEFREQMAALNVDYIDEGGNTDWQKEISRRAMTHSHNISLSGGTAKLKYFGSFGMQKQEGILKGSELNRYNARVNLNQSLLKDRLQVDVNFSASSTTNNRPPTEDILGSALVANPTYKAYNSEGNPYQYIDGTNPLLALQLNQDMTKTYRILGNIAPSLTIAKGLVYRLNFGIDVTNSKRDLQSLPFEQPLSLGRLENENEENTNRLIENYLTYTFKNSLHDFSALLGHSYQKIFLQGRTWSINNFPQNGIEPQYNPGLGQLLDLNNNRPTGFATINELQSYFSRVTYQLKDRYLLTATVRIDGSSKFGANNKYGVFPSFSAGWRLSEEDFMTNSPFDDLKIRAGYGLTGNQEIPSKITQALFTSTVSSTTSYPLGSGSDYPGGTTYARLANPDIQWEVSTQTDIGLDYSLWSGRLSGAVDYFHKISNDILLEVIPADPVQPAGTYWTNVHDMKVTNKGVEFDILYRQKLSKDMSFDIGGNVTFIDNIVKGSPYSVIPSGSASGPGLTSATINGYINGQPIGTFFLKQFTGLDENGESTYSDVDGDGIITDKDRVAAGTALPRQMYNINGSFRYKGLDMSFNFNGVAGNEVYDNTANANFYKLRLSKAQNTTAEAIEYPNESINNSSPISTRYLKSGEYFRLNNLALGYSFNTTKLGIAQYIPSLRLSLTGQNLFRITKYNGYDPDVNTNKEVSGVSSYGIDYLSYPKARSFVIGLNVGL